MSDSIEFEDFITSLIPYNDDVLIFGLGDGSLWTVDKDNNVSRLDEPQPNYIIGE